MESWEVACTEHGTSDGVKCCIDLDNWAAGECRQSIYIHIVDSAKDSFARIESLL